MAIRKLKSGKYKPLLRGTDGKWLPLGSFETKGEAEAVEFKARTEKKSGRAVTGDSKRITLNDYFLEWAESGTSKASPGWKIDQVQMYMQYIGPVIGEMRLSLIRSAEIARILDGVSRKGRAPQTQRHVYNLLHKLMGDAVEMFEYIAVNPVKSSLRPIVPVKETAYLKVDEAARLLHYANGKPFEMAIWLSLYVGMRVGEIQALKWQSVDFARGVIHVRATYVRKEKRIQDHPKGKEWHSVTMPPELFDMLKRASIGKRGDSFVVPSPRREMMNYDGYLNALKRYCRMAHVSEVATHGLRHSTSGIYLANGATTDDLYRLFNHSSISVTERYIHDKGENVREVAKLIHLFPEPDNCNSKNSKMGELE